MQNAAQPAKKRGQRMGLTSFNYIPRARSGQTDAARVIAARRKLFPRFRAAKGGYFGWSRGISPGWLVLAA